jgi:MFS family permease
LKEVVSDWGGGTTAFFVYTHSSHDLCHALIAPLLPLIKIGLGLTYLQSGLLLSAFAISSGLSQFVGGWLGDRFSQRSMVTAGLGGVGLATLAAGLSPSYYPLLIAFVTMGLCSGAYHPSATAMLSSRFGAERLGKVMGFHIVGGSLGFAVGPVIGGLIADALGWHFAFIILSFPALIAAPLALSFLGHMKKSISPDVPANPKPITDGSNVDAINPRIGVFQVLRPIAALFIVAVLTQLIAGSAMAFIPLYLVGKHAISPTLAAISMGILRGGGMVGSLFGGWLSDKWSRRKAILLIMVLTGPILYLLTILPANAFFVLALIIFGMIMIMRQSTFQPYLMDKTPPQLRATVFGIYFGLNQEGMSLVQPVAGHFMDLFGILDVFHFIALMSIGLSLAALVLARPRLSFH